MIRRVIQTHRMDEHSEVRQNLEYWLSRPPEERLAAVDELRRQAYGDSHRLRRVARVVTLEEFTGGKEAGGAGNAADVKAAGKV